MNFLKNWWQRSVMSASHAEGRLLQRIAPPSASPLYPLIGRSVAVPIGNSNHVNTFTLGPASKDNGSAADATPLIWNYTNSWTEEDMNAVAAGGNGRKNIVLAHGYGAGLAFMYK
jgi:cardiolipin-specific phospholipase